MDTSQENNQKAQPSIGTILRTRREELHLSMEDVSGVLAVSKRNLRAIEEDRTDTIPEDLYRELFLKSYATYLGFEWETLYAQYATETAQFRSSTKESFSGISKRNDHHRLSRSTPHRLLKRALLLTGLGACFSYLIFFGYTSIQSPELVVTSPERDMTTATPSLEITGRTAEYAQLALNGRAITKDASGAFREILTLREGVNEIVITAARKYSLSRSVTRRIFFRREVGFEYTESDNF